MLSFPAIIVAFEQSAYSVNEELSTVQTVLTLSNPSATDITVQVISTDLSTSGKNIISVANVSLIPTLASTCQHAISSIVLIRYIL